VLLLWGYGSARLFRGRYQESHRRVRRCSGDPLGRRRLGPMLGGRLDMQLLIYSLIFTIPGTPILWYGEEIGMGEYLNQEEQNSVRAPMQRTADRNAGFSTADATTLSTGTYRVLETSEPTKVFALICQDENWNAVTAVHNLTETPVSVFSKLWEKTFDHFIHLFDERPNEKIKKAEIGLELPGFGFSWLRSRQKKQI
jgi:glycosidase